MANRESVGVAIADVVVVRLAQVFVFIVVGIDSTDLATLQQSGVSSAMMRGMETMVRLTWSASSELMPPRPALTVT